MIGAIPARPLKYDANEDKDEDVVVVDGAGEDVAVTCAFLNC